MSGAQKAHVQIAVLATQGAAAAKRVLFRLPAVLQIQPIPSGLLSNRLVSSFRRHYSAQSRALSTTPPEFSSERCRHPTTSLPAHHGILFVNNVKPSHFPVQFPSSEQQALTFDFEVKTHGHLCTCACRSPTDRRHWQEPLAIASWTIVEL